MEKAAVHFARVCEEKEPITPTAAVQTTGGWTVTMKLRDGRTSEVSFDRNRNVLLYQLNPDASDPIFINSTGVPQTAPAARIIARLKPPLEHQKWDSDYYVVIQGRRFFNDHPLFGYSFSFDYYNRVNRVVANLATPPLPTGHPMSECDAAGCAAVILAHDRNFPRDVHTTNAPLIRRNMSLELGYYYIPGEVTARWAYLVHQNSELPSADNMFNAHSDIILDGVSGKLLETLLMP